jgi:hypothetical protein
MLCSLVNVGPHSFYISRHIIARIVLEIPPHRNLSALSSNCVGAKSYILTHLPVLRVTGCANNLDKNFIVFRLTKVLC